MSTFSICSFSFNAMHFKSLPFIDYYHFQLHPISIFTHIINIFIFIHDTINTFSFYCFPFGVTHSQSLQFYLLSSISTQHYVHVCKFNQTIRLSSQYLYLHPICSFSFTILYFISCTYIFNMFVFHLRYLSSIRDVFNFDHYTSTFNSTNFNLILILAYSFLFKESHIFIRKDFNSRLLQFYLYFYQFQVDLDFNVFIFIQRGSYFHS